MQFQKGQSGNPGGRAKSEQAALQRIKGLTVRAIDKLGSLMQSDNEQVALAAVKDILDRGLGRARQNVAVQHDVNFGQLHLAALQPLADKAREPLTIDVSPVGGREVSEPPLPQRAAGAVTVAPTAICLDKNQPKS